MTFEEFLIKKKIDAIQLKAKEQAFFAEFESHFIYMGEKSFDHSKKFWFNKLRRAYHLKEEPKPVKEEAKIAEIPDSAQNKSAIEAINQEKPAYVPRFKAAIKMPENVEDTGLNKEPESEEKVKPAYKPRFKPGLTKKDPDSE